MAAGVGSSALLGANGSATQQVAIALGDTAASNIPPGSRGIYVGVSGDVNVLLVGDIAPVIWKSVPIGIMPVSATRVYATNTGATNLIALY